MHLEEFTFATESRISHSTPQSERKRKWSEADVEGDFGVPSALRSFDRPRGEFLGSILRGGSGRICVSWKRIQLERKKEERETMESVFCALRHFCGKSVLVASEISKYLTDF